MVSVSQLGSRFRVEFLSTLIATVSGALLVVILARLLDPTGYGLLYLTLAVIGVARLFAKLGIGRSTARYIAEYREKDPSQLRHILSFSAGITLTLLLVVTLVVGLGHQQISGLIGEPDLAIFLIVGSLFLFFETSLEFIRKVLQGFEEIKSAASLPIIKSLIKLAVAIGLVAAGFGAIGALAGWVLGALFASLVGGYIIYFRHYQPLEQGFPVESGLRRRIAQYAVPLTASEAAGNLSGRIDMVLIGFFLNPVAVSYYTISKQVVTMIQSPVNALGFTLAPTFGKEKTAGHSEGAARLYEESFVHIMLLYIPAAVGIVLIADPLVVHIFGSNYSNAVPVLQILALYAIIQANLNISPSALDFIGRARERAIVKGVTSIMNFILNIVLIPSIGVVGAAIATLITSSIYASSNMYLLHQEFNFRINYLAWKVGRIILVSFLMGMVVQQLVHYILGVTTLFAIVVVGLVVWVIASTVLGLIDIRNILDALS